MKGNCAVLKNLVNTVLFGGYGGNTLVSSIGLLSMKSSLRCCDCVGEAFSSSIQDSHCLLITWIFSHQDGSQPFPKICPSSFDSIELWTRRPFGGKQPFAA